MRDLGRAARTLRRTPGFTALAVLTIALGLGANITIFSVLDAVVLEPLPWPQPDTRAMVWSRWRNFDKTWVNPLEMTTYARLCPSVAEAAWWQTGQSNLTGDGEAVRVGTASVSAATFSVLGVPPARGRGFLPEEDRDGGPKVAILSHELWQGRYAGDPGILGRRVEIDRVPHTVVGVMPPGFALPTDFSEDAAEPTRLLVPRAPEPEELTSNDGHGDHGAVRLAPGATLKQLNGELRTAVARMTQDGVFPREMKFEAFAVSLSDEVLGSHRPALWLVTSAVWLLLLIACANVASLLLARAEGRRREMALRAALGAARRQMVGQLLTEGLLLSWAGVVLGLVLAEAALRSLAALASLQLPRAAAAAVDPRAAVYGFLLATAVTVLFALGPAFHASRVDLTDALQEGGQRSRGRASGRRWRSALVLAETALAVILATGAGLMARSLHSLQRIDVGFEPRGVLTLSLALPAVSYSGPAQTNAFYRALLERVRALPGVEQAGLLRRLPLGQAMGDRGIDVEGYVEDAAGASAEWQVVSGGAAEALRERLRAGRFLSDDDVEQGPQAGVINQAMARKFWPGLDPVGRRFRVGSGAPRPWVTVVGVVQDVKQTSLTAVVKPKFYRPLEQFHVSTGYVSRNANLVVRGGDPRALAPSIREVVRGLDPAVPVSGVQTLEEVVASAVATPRFTGLLMGLFAGLALTLAAVGLYGVLSLSVSERAPEIGIRMALGALPRQVMRLVLRDGLGLLGVGLAIGLVLSLAGAGLLRSLLHEVAPADPVTFAAVPVVLAGVSLLAAWWPVRRALRLDPMTVLREE
jgi:putative ABC transport system permease protein